ncbi:hypothetical protein [Rickettsia felis]|uniref:hypothetical protein n=1 Tax=Rickettsia felis TaxID=42862 RepID=UPI001F30B568|nr:hypothetical protein [Rickettsia felis]
MGDYHPALDVIPWIPSRHCEEALLRRPIKPTVSPCGLLTRSIKTIKNTNNFSILTGSRGQATG